MSRRTTQLRQLLLRPTALLAPGAFGPMPAKLAERAGFEAVYLPGGGSALNRLGVADVGVFTMTEMVDSARAVAESVSVPVICDADSGFGNHLNVQRAVREYERAGVAAIHIEDQTFPKRSGHFSGKSLVATEEAVQKIKAAVAARSDPDFIIIARCDAMSVGGFDEVVRRCTAYHEAGADMLFVEAPNSIEIITKIPQVIPGTHLFNMSAGGSTPALTIDEVTRLGYRMMIMPNFSSLVTIRAVREMYAEIRQTGSVAGIRERAATFREFMELGDFDTYEAADHAFAASAPKKSS
ncbi:carboxyvinyl-carboxyphosphonate phosphorylmutase [Rhizobium leguminosarum bv. viciae]|uniref:isocitrate lyase/PEP mutase family protein n=1 Tax=Rhizobium leguminosarum TaxID=384 RepID=UPI0014411DC2|nr:oxaloacetate decarboxylase [Rhizobium leguminosarum]NKK87437.1 carboxyvinyl-carboxyphosphonate phosphorylmutase [Rhizobium leguminosarum bv. viciae]